MFATAAAAVTQTSQAVTFAIVGGVFALITLFATNIFSSRTKRAEWEREDQVADRAEAAAAALLQATHDNSQTMGRIAKTQDIIHDLVNSQYTATKESEYSALVGQLATMQELATLRGGPISQGTGQAIATLTKRVAELGAELVIRRRNDEVAVEAARAASSERSAADTQVAAAERQHEAAVMQDQAAQAQIAVAEAQADVADKQAEANKAANPQTEP